MKVKQVQESPHNYHKYCVSTTNCLRISKLYQYWWHNPEKSPHEVSQKELQKNCNKKEDTLLITWHHQVKLIILKPRSSSNWTDWFWMSWSSLQLLMSTHVLSSMRHMKEPSVLMLFWDWWKTCFPKEQISKSSSHQLQWRSHCSKNISTRRLSKFQAECILSTLNTCHQKKKKWSRKSKKPLTNNC